MAADVKKTIAFNLISFHDTRAVGTFVFMRRLFVQMGRSDLSGLHIVVYIQKHLSVPDLRLPENCSLEIVRVPSLRSAFARTLFEQTLFYLYMKKAGALFSPSSISMPFFGRAYKIQTIHDLLPFVFPKKYGRLKLLYLKALTRAVARRCDHIVTVSRNSKQDLENFLGVDPSKISVIYNFIPEGEPAIRRDALSSDPVIKAADGTEIDMAGDYFLTVATLQPGKNIEGLLKAFRKFADGHPGCRLCVVGGKGWNYESIFELARRLGLMRDVTFTGYVDDTNLAKIFERCLGVVYVSYYEGFGIPPLEGFYHGKACVASNVSSIPEVVGNAGILVDPYDTDRIAEAMESFLSRRMELEANTEARTRDFDPAVQTDKFLDLLKRMQ